MTTTSSTPMAPIALQPDEGAAGAFVYGPRDVPHTLTVPSEHARFLPVTEPAGFENFMRALSDAAGSTGDRAGPDRTPGHGSDAPARRQARYRDTRASRHPGPTGAA